MKFYFIYRQRDDKGEIVKMGISPKYTDKNEMYLNAEFMQRSGYDIQYKIE